MVNRVFSPQSFVLALALLLSLAMPSGTAHAATITVNTATDVVANDGQCSLREAITAANTDTASGATGGECAAGSGDDTITLPLGTYTLAISGASEDKLEALFNEERRTFTAMLGKERPGVGAFEGAMYEARGLYRPSADCVMFTRDEVGFCPVCAAAIERIIDLHSH